MGNQAYEAEADRLLNLDILDGDPMIPWEGVMPQQRLDHELLFDDNEHVFNQNGNQDDANQQQQPPEYIPFIPRTLEPFEYVPSLTLFKKHKKKLKLETRKLECLSECPICCIDIKKNIKIPDIKCKHVFHKKCLLQWLKKSDSCPLCRDDVNN